MIDVATTNVLLWQILANRTLFTLNERGQESAYTFETTEFPFVLKFKFVTEGTTDDITQLPDIAIRHQQQAHKLLKLIVALETLIVVFVAINTMNLFSLSVRK